MEKGVIFGYNTEVRNGDTIYHIQSEARGGARLLETLVFVAGRCIAKRLTPTDSADAQATQERLRKQHRFVLDCVREGLLELGAPANQSSFGTPPPSTPTNRSSLGPPKPWLPEA